MFATLDFLEIKKLYKIFIKSEIGFLFIGFILTLTYSAIGLILPYLSRFLIDEVLIAKNVNMMVPYVTISLVIFVSLAILGIIANYILISSFQRINVLMRTQLFSNILKAPIEFVSNQRSGEISYRIFQDTEIISNFFMSLLTTLPVNFLFLIAISIIMYFWNAQLALLSISILIVQGILLQKFRPLVTEYAIKQKNSMQYLNGYVVEQFRNIQAIRAFGIEKKVNHRLLDKLVYLKSINIKSFMVNKFADLSINTSNNLWSLAILVYGGTLVISDVISLGTLTAFMLISNMLYPTLTTIISIILAFQDVKISILRFNEYLNVIPAIEDHDNLPILEIISGDISLNNVQFGYYNSSFILKDIDIKFMHNKITLLVGKSGSGKTTIAKLIARFYDPIQGDILIDNHSIRSVSLESLREQITFIPQTDNIFSGTLLENILICGGNPSMQEVHNAIELAHAEFIYDLDLGLQTMVGEGGIQLSTGQLQRIILIRCFLRKSKIIILDEPTSSVDVMSEKKIIEAIFKLKESATVILLTHHKKLLDIADSIILVENGTTKQYDNCNEFKSNNYGKELLDINAI